jgi:hypothetical protein
MGVNSPKMGENSPKMGKNSPSLVTLSLFLSSRKSPFNLQSVLLRAFNVTWA